MNPAEAVSARVQSLHVYPVKSCAEARQAPPLVCETGLDLDRAWMVVDAAGGMLTQREHPRLALVQPAIRGSTDVVLRAPGMLALHLSQDVVEAATRVRVWDDEVQAFEMGALAAQWFSDFLGLPGLRLVRLDPDERRWADRAWTAGRDAEVSFADGFPLLVANAASLADLNARLAARGALPVTMARFRPNLVLEGLPAWEEDHLDELTITTPEGPLRLALVKPCVRCSIPDTDPLSAVRTPEVGDELRRFRIDPRMKGGITFGMNAIVLEGMGSLLAPGQPVQGRWRFAEN